MLMTLSMTVSSSTVHAADATSTEINAPGPQGDLAGTLLVPSGGSKAVVLIIPGSGPTNRDGDNPLGVRAQPYKLLAEGLAQQGIASVRIDKRGMFGSGRAVADANAVTIDDYVQDTLNWIDVIRRRLPAHCVWLLGHSEGGLVALATAHAAGSRESVCGLVLLATAGRPLGAVLRSQIEANPANAPIAQAASDAIGSLEAGRRVDISTLPAPLGALFHPAVQGFLISEMALDPATLIADIEKPILIVQGERDLQVGVGDAERLKHARPSASLVLLPNANHLLKPVTTDDPAANLATYANPDLPLVPQAVDDIARFVTNGSD
jgi:pimeloyl-ACP methyl ester carboxylesterase